METIVMNEGMLASGIVLVISFILIFTETLHGYHRSKIAMAGAGAMLLVGQYYDFYTPDAAFEAIDWNVVFLLGSMMAIVSIMITTGGFERMAAQIGRIAKGRQFLLMALLGTAVTLLSLLLDNVTTVVIFGPLIVLIAQKMKVSPIPYLMAAALLSDTGGVATLVGDPPNLMIGSAVGISFMTFFQYMGGIVFVAWLGTLFALKYLCREELAIVPQGTFDEDVPYKDKGLWNKSCLVLGLLVILFVSHDAIHWQPWMVAGAGFVLICFLAKNVELDEVMKEVEMTLLIFFISLFIIVGGVEHSHFLAYLGQFIVEIYSLWWALALGVGMGGNGTHIGSTANVYIVTVSERLAKREGNPELAITPLKWAKIGLPVMLITLVICTIIMYFFFDFYSAEFPRTK
jgi:Na+/H+ antiporter NhaD/arsenite permease-like protein